MHHLFNPAAGLPCRRLLRHSFRSSVQLERVRRVEPHCLCQACSNGGSERCPGLRDTPDGGLRKCFAGSSGPPTLPCSPPGWPRSRDCRGLPVGTAMGSRRPAYADAWRHAKASTGGGGRRYASRRRAPLDATSGGVWLLLRKHRVRACRACATIPDQHPSKLPRQHPTAVLMRISAAPGLAPSRDCARAQPPCPRVAAREAGQASVSESRQASLHSPAAILFWILAGSLASFRSMRFMGMPTAVPAYPGHCVPARRLASGLQTAVMQAST